MGSLHPMKFIAMDTRLLIFRSDEVLLELGQKENRVLIVFIFQLNANVGKQTKRSKGRGLGIFRLRSFCQVIKSWTFSKSVYFMTSLAILKYDWIL